MFCWFRTASYLQRKSEVLNCYIKPWSQHLNPPMSPRDKQWKLKICNVPNDKTCFVTGKTSGVGRGDHVFETKGYYNLTGKFGVDDDWNTLPVAGSLNNSYKIFQFKDGHVKHVGFQTLTPSELSECTKKQKHIYGVIRRWRAYTKRRNIKMSFRPTAEQKRILNKARALHEQHAKEHSRLFSQFNVNGQRKRSLQRFVQKKLIICKASELVSAKSLLPNSYYVDKEGRPIGTKLNDMRTAYREWGHRHTSCRHYTCRAFKTRLCRVLGRNLDAHQELWKTPKGRYYYKGCFLRK